jgi:hypothetical protein
MSIRRSLIGLVGVAAFALAACSSTASSGLPTLPASGVASAAPSGSAALQGFCADFAAKVAAKWPNIDSSTAVTLAPLIQQWATKPEMSSVAADATTVFTWVSGIATAGAAASPPADVMTAFDHLKAFADANC